MDWMMLISVLFVLKLFSTGITETLALKCYACGDSNTFADQHQLTNNKQLSCDELEKSEGEALKRFIIECPAGYGGCITQKQGDQLMRACDSYAFDDCQSANGITYCYCRGNLCNKPGVIQKTIATHIDLTKITDITDDEDYIEMSGNGDTDEFDFDKDGRNNDDDIVQLLITSTKVTELEATSTTNWTSAATRTTELIHNTTMEMSTTITSTIDTTRDTTTTETTTIVVPQNTDIRKLSTMNSSANRKLFISCLKTSTFVILLKFLFY